MYRVLGTLVSGLCIDHARLEMRDWHWRIDRPGSETFVSFWPRGVVGEPRFIVVIKDIDDTGTWFLLSSNSDEPKSVRARGEWIVRIMIALGIPLPETGVPQHVTRWQVDNAQLFKEAYCD